jgi:hypothetical protein
VPPIRCLTASATELGINFRREALDISFANFRTDPVVTQVQAVLPFLLKTRVKSGFPRIEDQKPQN